MRNFDWLVGQYYMDEGVQTTWVVVFYSRISFPCNHGTRTGRGQNACPYIFIADVQAMTKAYSR